MHVSLSEVADQDDASPTDQGRRVVRPLGQDSAVLQFRTGCLPSAAVLTSRVATSL